MKRRQGMVAERTRRLRTERKTKWRAHRIKLLVAGLTALGALVFGSATALGNQYTFEKEFGSATLALPAGLAVDNSGGTSKGDVYVADYPEAKVIKFSASGTELETINTEHAEAVYIAVDSSAGPSAGDLYVSELSSSTVTKYANGTKVCQISLGSFPSGAAPNGFTPFGPAVNPTNGNLYVADRANGMIDVFTEGCVYTGQFSPGSASLDSLATDSAGNVYVTIESGGVSEFTPAGVPVATGTISNGGTQSVAVDLSNNDIFIGAGGEVGHYNSGGTLIPPTFGAGTFGGPNFGLAVNDVTHTVYGSGLEAHKVNIFTVVPESLAVTTGPAEHLSTKATELTGTVTPEEAPEATEIEFQYGLKGDVEEHTVPANVTTATSEVHVHAELTGLTPGTEYEYRLVATAEGTPVHGTTLPFSTLPLGVAETEAATEVTTEGAKLNGKAISNEGAGEYFFEYGKEGSIEEHTTSATAFTGTEPVSAPVAGLTPGQPYEYRLVVKVEGTTIPDATPEHFTTIPLVEGKNPSVTAPSAEGATLNGEIKTGSEGGGYQFEYEVEGEPASKKTTTLVEIPATAGGGFETVSTPVTGLIPGTKYVVRFLVFPKGSSTAIAGGETSFETHPAKPEIVEEFSENETRHGVSLGAEINPKNSETTYFFEYGKTTAYDRQTPGGTIPKGLTTVEVGPETVSELDPGTVYHYRVVAENGGGKVDGPDETFTTLAPTPPIVKSESSAQVTQTTATITGTINPNGLQTSYILEVGTEVEPGHIAYTPTFGEVGSGTEDVGLGFGLTNLQSGTTYHYRLVALNEDGTTEGVDQTFVTGSFPPVITLPGPVQIIPTPPQPIVKPPPPGGGETLAQQYHKAVKLCNKKAKRKYHIKTKKKKK